MASLKGGLTELYKHLFCLCYTYSAEHLKRKDRIGLIIYCVVMTIVLAS